jgi:Arc/MetJ-type ribon-helix-helix transcriptional regulator
MSIPISPEIENLVHGIYARGEYASEADVLAAALHLLQQRDRLRIDLQQGCGELDRGERLDANLVFGELRQMAAELDGRGK